MLGSLTAEKSRQNPYEKCDVCDSQSPSELGAASNRELPIEMLDTDSDRFKSNTNRNEVIDSESNEILDSEVEVNIVKERSISDGGQIGAGTATGKDISFNDSTRRMSEKDTIDEAVHFKMIDRVSRHVFTIWFTVMGLMGLLMWNLIVVCLLVFQGDFWSQGIFADLLLGFNKAGSLLAMAILILFSRITISKWLTRITAISTALSFLVLLLPCYLLVGQYKWGVTSLCAIVFVMGVNGGIYQAQIYAFGALIPRRVSHVIFISMGFGMAGIVTWAPLTALVTIYDKTIAGRQKAVLHLCILCTCITLATHLISEFVFKNSIFREAIRKSQAEQKIDSVKDDSSELPVVDRVKKCILPATRVGFVLASTIFIFPGVGPISWPLNFNQSILAMGIFQVGDFVFRLVPIFGAWTILSERTSNFLIFGRVLFLFPLFIIPVYHRDLPVLSSTWFLYILILIHVLTSSWCVTLSVVHCMSYAKTQVESQTTSTVMTALLVIGAMVGAFGSKIPLLGYS